MDVATTTTTASTNNTHTNHNNNTSTPPTAKSPDQETETPTTRIQPPKPLSFTNGVLKRQHHHHHHHHHHPVVISYKECLKNHAASLGGHALDGCGEFMPSPSAVHTDPTSLKCAACGCHRNFHRREPEDSPNSPHRHPSLISNATTTIEYQPHNRHHPPPPPPATVAQQPYRSPNSASPPPISSSYPSSAPHMLLALSGGASGLNESTGLVMGSGGNSSSRKRFRTKFSQLQKDKMYKFSERVGWKMQKRDEEIIQEFCNEIGVDKGVLKVWMHNNKNTFGKKDGTPNGNGNENGNNGSGGSINLDQNNNSSVENVNRHRHNHHHLFENHDSVVTHHVGTNGSSSSS